MNKNDFVFTQITPKKICKIPVSINPPSIKLTHKIAKSRGITKSMEYLLKAIDILDNQERQIIETMKKELKEKLAERQRQRWAGTLRD